MSKPISKDRMKGEAPSTLVHVFESPKARRPTFVSYCPRPGDIVETAGYRSTEQQIAALQIAGQNLSDWRAATFPGTGEDGVVTPVFLDQLDAIDRLREVRRRVQERRQFREELAQRRDEASAAAPVPEASPAPTKSEPVADSK